MNRPTHINSETNQRLFLGSDNDAVSHLVRMAGACALIGYDKVKLHWEQALAELGGVSERDGFYPYVAYELPPYRKFARCCPVAEAVAQEVGLELAVV